MINDINKYPADAQRVLSLFQENKTIFGYNGLYRASHGRLYNVTIQYGENGLEVSYFAYGYLNKYYNYAVSIIKTYLMFVMDTTPVQESHLTADGWKLIYDSSNFVRS